MTELRHLVALFAGLVAIAMGLGLFRLRGWSSGRGARAILVIGGAAGVVSSGVVYFSAVNARQNSWYVLNVSANSCPALYALNPPLSTPDDMITQVGCQIRETNVPRATRVFCPREQLNFYLFSNQGSCDAAIPVFRAARPAGAVPK